MRLVTRGVLLGVVLVAGAAQAVPERKLEPTFRRLGHIHGYFVTPSGEGLNGLVALCTPDGRTISLHHTTAMRKGRFDIDNLFSGQYRLRVVSVGPYPTDLEPPDDMAVVVRPNRVVRPRIVADVGGRRDGRGGVQAFRR
jgi:hypothetical protein